MVKKLLIIFVIVVSVGTVGFSVYYFFDRLRDYNPFTSRNTPQETYYGFEKEGIVLENPALHNFEVIKTLDGKYRMYYHDSNSIKSAVSDDGKEFNLEDGVRLQGQMSSTVILPDGRFRMYFVSETKLKSAVSSDGLNFTIETGDRLIPGAEGEKDSFGIIHPSVLVLPDGTYKLFYDGVSGESIGPSQWYILSATSKDGLVWVKDDGVRIPHPEENSDDSEEFEVKTDVFITSAFSPHIEYNNTTYELYFASETSPLSNSGIWLATSSDGLNFTVKENPVISREKEFGDRVDNASQGGPRGVAQDPFVLKTTEGERLFYWIVEKGIFSALRKN